MHRLVSTPTRRLPSTALLVLAVLVLSALGTGVCSAGPASTSAAPHAGAAAGPWPKAAARCRPDGAAGSGVACTFSDGKAGVTVSQTKNLINQTVDVAWYGLPETTNRVQGANAENGVAVLQCWGTDPTRDHCWPWANYLGGFQHYSATGDPEEVQPWLGFRTTGNLPPFTTAAGKTYDAGITAAPDYAALAPNEVLGETAADGTGTTRFEVRDRNALRSLGCAAGSACSLVVIPVINPLHDDDDYSDTGAYFGMQLSATNWNRRAVIPLDFAPQGAPCPAANASLEITTSEVAENMVRRWQPTLCSTGVNGVKVDAGVTTLSDRLTRESVGNGVDDLALVSRPVPATGVTYAPLAGAGVVIGFSLTNAETGRPFTQLKITPRLMAKLLTQSYCGFVCGDGTYPGDPNVAHPDGKSLNPSTLAQDPELFALNPQLATGTGVDRSSLVSGASPVEVSFSDSDVFHRLTQWIDADPAARAWLDGKPDEYGMIVNKAFRGWDLPLEGPEKRDAFVLPTSIHDCPGCTYAGQNYLDLSYQFASNMATVAANVSQGWSSATLTAKTDPLDITKIIGFGRVDASTLPGSDRFILGVMSSAQAGAFGLDTAAVPRPDGTFVTPTTASLTAAVAAATKDPATGLWSVAPGAGGPTAYPLTLIEHAVARTSGLSKEVAAAGSAFVSYAATGGQVVGTDLGQLPAGYVPVTAAMAAQSKAAAAVIAAASKPVAITKPTPKPTATLLAGTSSPTPSVPAGTPSPNPASTPSSIGSPNDPTQAADGGAGSSGNTGSTGDTGGSTGTGDTGGVVPDATQGGQSGTSGSAGSTGSDGTTTGSTDTTGGSADSGTSGSTTGGSGPAAGPVPSAGTTPVAGTGGDGSVVPGSGVAPTAGALSNTAGQAAQPGTTTAPAAGTLRWALLALLVLALAAGVSAPLLAGTGRGARVIASVRGLFTR